MQRQVPRTTAYIPLRETPRGGLPTQAQDYPMIKNFMISGSLNQGMELEEILYESDTMPFLREDTIMIVYDEHPHQEVAMCLT
jgi:hypothetical protein